jgi:hypothetical protein
VIAARVAGKSAFYLNECNVRLSEKDVKILRRVQKKLTPEQECGRPAGAAGRRGKCSAAVSLK